MSDVTADVLKSAAGRWRRIDPLLPDPAPAHAGCGASLIVPAAPGRAAAAGWCRHREVAPGDEAGLAWGAAAQFWLAAHVAGDPGEPGTGAALDELLAAWRGHLASEPAAADQDSQAAVRWPSRDIGGVRALLRHGLQPLTVIAARIAARALADVPAPADLTIRPAGPGDVAAVTDLAVEVIRFDQHFGSVRLCPHAEEAEWRAARENLARPQPWTWLAERDGQAVGLVVAEPPDRAGWIASATSASPAAYLATMSVRPGHRGSGVGSALVALLHRELDAAGVAVTLLHHGMLNPLSAPFWNRMGYRPLWTNWEIRPARALR